MNRIRLILIEDNRLLRDGLKAILKKEPDINVIAEFGDSGLDPEAIAGLKPHVLLIDLGLADLDSFELIKQIIEKYPDVKIIAMDLMPIQEDIMRYIEAGVSGFMLKDATIPEFMETIRSVASGKKVLPPNLTGTLFSQIMDYGVKEMNHSKLKQSLKMTNREHEIVNLISDGMSNKQIAAKLNISVYTVKSHVHNILEKLEFHRRIQIAIYAQNIPPEKDKP